MPACRNLSLALAALAISTTAVHAQSAETAARLDSRPIVLHAAHLLDVAGGKLISPGEILIAGPRIREVGEHVARPKDARIIDLGATTLMPGLIDVHTHLFLHVGDEANQTVDESVPQRTLIAAAAAKTDLMAGFTAERDMGTEGAGCADVAVRNAINSGLILGPRMRVSCNAIDLTGGHEDNNGRNPEQHLLSNADRADSADALVSTMREQHKQGADFTKIYETGSDRLQTNPDGTQHITAPYQYSESELARAVAEAQRVGTVVAVHATAEPGTGFAVRAGVVTVDHAYSLSPETMALMKERGILAVPTFTISKYFADHASSPAITAQRRLSYALHVAEFHKQLAAGVPMAVGSDVGPFPHGTQAEEYELMVTNGMSPAEVLRAGLINGAKVLNWANEIGQLKPNFYADVVAVPGDPLTDIRVLTKPVFVMKNGEIVRDDIQPQR